MIEQKFKALKLALTTSRRESRLWSSQMLFSPKSFSKRPAPDFRAFPSVTKVLAARCVTSGNLKIDITEEAFLMPCSAASRWSAKFPT